VADNGREEKAKALAAAVEACRAGTTSVDARLAVVLDVAHEASARPTTQPAIGRALSTIAAYSARAVRDYAVPVDAARESLAAGSLMDVEGK
jgi:hypothetical protein